MHQEDENQSLSEGLTASIEAAWLDLLLVGVCVASSSGDRGQQSRQTHDDYCVR